MPTPLHRNTICIDLAKAMYYAHSGYYGIVAPDFSTLSTKARQVWVERAKEQILVVGEPRLTAQAEYDEGFNSAKKL